MAIVITILSDKSKFLISKFQECSNKGFKIYSVEELKISRFFTILRVPIYRNIIAKYNSSAPLGPESCSCPPFHNLDIFPLTISSHVTFISAFLISNEVSSNFLWRDYNLAVKDCARILRYLKKYISIFIFIVSTFA